MVTQRLAALIGAPVCLIAVYDPGTRTMSVALPAHGMSDEVARGIRYQVKPEYRNMWNFRSGRPYLSNHARSDPRLLQEIVRLADMESVVLVPMLSEGSVLGLLVAANKPGGFTDADVQLLSMFAGPAASFLRSRQIFSRQRHHAARLERLAALVAEMSAAQSRSMLLQMRPPAPAPTSATTGWPSSARADGGGLQAWSGSPSGPPTSRTTATWWAGRSAARGRCSLPRRSGPSWRCPCAPASARSACSTCCARRACPSTRRRSTSSPPWPASSRSPCRRRRARPRPSAWPRRWPPSTTWAWRPPPCATCARCSRRPPRRPAASSSATTPPCCGSIPNERRSCACSRPGPAIRTASPTTPVRSASARAWPAAWPRPAWPCSSTTLPSTRASWSAATRWRACSACP